MEKKANINNVNTLQNSNAVKPIYNITPFTLLDYPDKTACILWFAGCNMRCVYCYNPDIVFGKGKISVEETLRFLQSRKVLLDGVVLSGGECTSHKSLIPLICEIKKMGFLVKIDTNGSNPEVLKKIIEEGLVDYIALDFKATKNKFTSITQSNLLEEFCDVLKHLIDIRFPFEVRTTVHSELLTNYDIQEMAQLLEYNGYNGRYFLQYYLNGATTIEDVGNSKNNYLNLNDIKSPIEIIIRN